MTPISEAAGNCVVVTGKDPMILNDPDYMAVVSQGRADVFFATLDASGIPDSRYHLARLEPGEAASGMAAEPGGGIYILVGIGETEVSVTRMDEAYDADPENAAARLSEWFGVCFKSASREMKVPRETIQEVRKGEIPLPEGKSFNPGGSGWWVTRLSGEARFLDVPVEELPLPVPEKGWITASGDATLTLAPLHEILAGPDRTDGIAAFHRTTARALISRRRADEEETRRRYDERREGDRRRKALAFQGMAGILTGRKSVSSTQGLPPLVAAAIQVGNAAGIAILEETVDAETGVEPTLEDIARHNSFRTREVIIAEKWWQQDHDPLLAFREADGDPVALIPRGHRGYYLVDPITDERRPLTWELADGLSPKAYTFYRPFPHKALGWMDLIRFGGFRTGADLLRMVCMGSLAGLLGLLTPLATGLILGTYIPGAERGDILQITLILVATAGAIAMFNVVKGIATVRLEGRMDLSIQAAVWDRLLSLPVPFFKDYSAGDLALRAMGISAIRQILSGNVLNAILTLIFTLFNLLFLFYYDWQMAVVAICLTIIGAGITIGAGFVTVHFQKSLSDIQGRISGIMLQFITGINKLRITGAEERAFSVYAREYICQKQMKYHAGLADTFLFAFNAAFPVLVSMVLFAWFYWMRPGNLTVPEFVAFSSAYTIFQTALLQVSMVIPSTANIIPLYQRAKPIIQTLPEVNEASKKPGPLKGGVTISHASFRYSPDGPLILNDVCLTAEAGEFVAIVGGSGAGKSTLLRLLMGFETPVSGGIFYDGQDLKNLDIREVRRQIGVVLQNGQLMNGDIFRNIAGASSLTIEDAWKAARMVGIAEDIEAMPMKMNTMVPAGGGSLSGGQRQRLLIARAVANQPRILFFDEATSALDNQTQAIVSHSLEKLKVTRIVIAHRLSTIQHADRIYVMEQGRVVESGDFETLMSMKGSFYELAKRQIA